MKYNGGVPKEELAKENLAALEKGSENLAAHIDNLHKFGVPVVVAINHFMPIQIRKLNLLKIL